MSRLISLRKYDRVRWLMFLVLGLGGGAYLLMGPAGADTITYEMVTVGNPGNANNTAVDYSYQIGKYDVTIGQYTAFLNAVDPTGINPNGIYNSSMRTDLNIAGISNTGMTDGFRYSVMSPAGFVPASGVTAANRPITYVSWFDAARFANWMTNGQGSGSTETGAYTLNGSTSGDAVAANPGAAFRLPTENEWYKAAYYSPNYGGAGVPGYYKYATQSDTAPGNIIGNGANQANYHTGAGFSVTQRGPEYNLDQNLLTDVGAFSNSGSFFGTFDQNGNVFEWNDLDGAVGSSRQIRGAFWGNGPDPAGLSSSYSLSIVPSQEEGGIGFRLASPVVVPEPSTYAMALVGLACGGWQVWRRRQHSSVT